MSTVTQIFSTYLHVLDGGRLGLVPAPRTFWGDLAEGKFPELDQGRLLSAISFDEACSSWERHPGGDELVMLLSGRATVVLEESGVEREVALEAPGDYVMVPRNTWHTARTSVPTSMLFLTPGAGTEHRPVV